MAGNRPSSTDSVYPTHIMDDISAVKPLIMSWTICFNDVLDAEKLHQALSKLLQIGDWKKLGGRLKIREDRHGALEIHVPSSFTETRPSIAFSHQHYDIAIEEHTVARLLPKATHQPSIQAGPSAFQDLAIPPGALTTLKDFIGRDVPMLSLHVVSFQDATLVTISWPHVLFDAAGFCHLIEAWSSVLAEQEERVPDLLGAKEDVLYELGDISQTSPHSAATESRMLTGLWLVVFLIRFFWAILTQPTVENRTICIPRNVVDRLHRRVLEDIQGETVAVGHPWVSPSDAILGWLSRTAVTSTLCSHSISMISPIDARSRLSHLQDSKGVYIQNMLLASFVTLSPEVLRGSLGKQALVSRQSLLDQLQETNLVGILQLLRKRWDDFRTGSPIFAAPGSVLLITNNRLKIDIFSAADFRPAVLRAEKKEPRSNPLGTPVYHYATPLNAGITFRNFVNIHTIDREGNYWLSGFFTPRQWSKIEDGFQELY